MIRLQTYKTLLIVGISLVMGLSHATDAAKEKRWADEVTDSIMVGDAEWLKAGKSKIFSIYTESTTNKTIGGAIILHGSGVHPNWDQVIRPLRSQLPDFGWSTLSVQLPVLANDAEYKEYIPLFKDVAPRLNAAVKFFKSKGVRNIVVIAHSLGAGMAGYYMGNKPDSSIRALVAIGVSGVVYKSDVNVGYLTSLEKIKVPVLDIFGSNDLDIVLEGKELRAKTARKVGNKRYTQIEVAGANHFFDNKEDVLVKRIRGWLLKNAAGTEFKIK